MPKYDHYLITKNVEGIGRSSAVIPFALLPSTTPFEEIVNTVLKEVESRTLMFLSAAGRSNSVEVLRKFTDAYFTDTASNMYFRLVRLSETAEDLKDYEKHVHWRLFDHAYSKPDAPNSIYQGPGDGVIPSATPVTIWHRNVPPRRLEIISDTEPYF